MASDGTPGQFSGTEGYVYDQIGNLTETTSNGNLTEIDWDVYNKVKQVTNENLLTRYLYDGAGNRVLTFKNVGFEDRRPVITGYSRDATGNTLAVYDLSNPEENPFFTPRMQEAYIFGSNRIGVDITPRNDLGNYFVDSYHKDLTTTHYEISNHLGNVLTTVTGRKLGQVQNDVLDHYLPEVVTATDYYAFGAQMPGRSYENTTLSGTNGYRYAFNGKEHDSDGEFGSLTHYDYGFRIYNPAIAKFLSVDPLTKDYPWYTPYQFAGNTPIWAIDLDGLEPQYSNSGSTAAGNSPARDNLPEVTWDDQVNKQYLVDLKEFSTSTHTQNVSNLEVFEPGSEPKSEPPKLGEPYRENVLMYNEVWSRMVLNLPAQGKVESTSFEFEVLGAGIVLKQILSAGSKMIIRAEAMKDGLNAAKGGSRVFEVGSYNTLKGVEAGLEAHHVGQRALMKKFVSGYNANTAPSILVPKQGHTSGIGVLSRGTSGFSNARQVLARDIFELRRVYPYVPNSSLKQLIQMNKTMYPRAFIK